MISYGAYVPSFPRRDGKRCVLSAILVGSMISFGTVLCAENYIVRLYVPQPEQEPLSGARSKSWEAPKWREPSASCARKGAHLAPHVDVFRRTSETDDRGFLEQRENELRDRSSSFQNAETPVEQSKETAHGDESAGGRLDSEAPAVAEARPDTGVDVARISGIEDEDSSQPEPETESLKTHVSVDRAAEEIRNIPSAQDEAIHGNSPSCKNTGAPEDASARAKFRT